MYRRDIIDKYPLDKGLEVFIDNINDTCGEGVQFELIIRLLNNLMSWQIVCFNNDNEKDSYTLNSSILNLLEKSYSIYQGKENE